MGKVHAAVVPLRIIREFHSWRHKPHTENRKLEAKVSSLQRFKVASVVPPLGAEIFVRAEVRWEGQWARAICYEEAGRNILVGTRDIRHLYFSRRNRCWSTGG